MITALEQGKELGLLGPGPVEDHLKHAYGFAHVVKDLDPLPHVFLDLGSGGGLPGLVIAAALSEIKGILLEAGSRRVAHLERAIALTDLGGRVTIAHGRAEEIGSRPPLRGAVDVVVARSFGRPSVTAECAAPLLRIGGHLVVSEPPSSGDSPPGRPGRPGLQHATPSTPLSRPVVSRSNRREDGSPSARGSADADVPAHTVAAMASDAAADREGAGGARDMDPATRRGPSGGRWPPGPLADLGLESRGTVIAEGFTYQVLQQVRLCPERFPRRVGVPSRRPLF